MPPEAQASRETVAPKGRRTLSCADQSQVAFFKSVEPAFPVESDAVVFNDEPDSYAFALDQHVERRPLRVVRRVQDQLTGDPEAGPVIRAWSERRAVHLKRHASFRACLLCDLPYRFAESNLLECVRAQLKRGASKVPLSASMIRDAVDRVQRNAAGTDVD